MYQASMTPRGRSGPAALGLHTLLLVAAWLACVESQGGTALVELRNLLESMQCESGPGLLCMVHSNETISLSNLPEPLIQNLTLQGTSHESSVWLSGSPMHLQPGRSLTLIGLNVLNASLDIGSWHFQGISMQPESALILKNTTAQLDCGSWLALHAAICDSGTLHGDALVRVFSPPYLPCGCMP